MASKLGPRIVTDNLVLALDCADAKSYAGEPTTNLSPNSDYSGASLNTINSGSNGGWGTTFDRWISEIEGPGGKTVKAFHLKLTGSTGSAPHAEGDASLISGIASQVASLTSGNSYRVSAWAKVIRANGSSTAQTSSNLLYLTGTAAIGSSSLTVNTTWTRISASFSISTTGSYRLYHYFYGVSVGDILVITEPQIELKSYNTPYVYSSRSATDGWVDLSGNSNDGTLVNDVVTGTSHYRSGDVILPNSARYLDFDGSDDYINVNHNSAFDTNIFTIEIWFKSTADDNTHDSLITRNGDVYTSSNGWSLGKLRNGLGSTTNALRWLVWGTSTYTDLTGDSTASGNWTQAVGVSDGTNLYLYQNGVQKASGSKPAGNIYPSSYGFKIGANKSSSDLWNGQIAAVKFYSDALSAAEVLQNYNSTRSRFS